MRDGSGSVHAKLEAAEQAARGGDPRAMAVALREAWRQTRSEPIAAIYEVLIAEASAERLSGDDPEALASAWIERASAGAGDPLLLPILLAHPWQAELSEHDRLRLLGAWSPDPALASALVDRLRLPVFPAGLPGASALEGETLRLLAAQRDPRAIASLERLAREPKHGSAQRRRLRATIATLEATPPRRLDARAEAGLAPLARRAKQRERDRAQGAELLAAIHADPDADGPRVVYADWLTAQGDPRGEFITLQLTRGTSSGPGERDATSRERALLERHGASWVGPLHAVLGPRRFERGFLVATSIEADELGAELAARPEWSTLQTLDGLVPELLALRGPLDRLRRLYGFLDMERFVALRAAGRLQSVVHYECSLADPNLRFDTPLGLRSLLVREALDDRLEALASSPAIAGLEELAVYYEPKIGARGRSWIRDHRERAGLDRRYELLSAALPSHVQRLRMIHAETSRASRPMGCELTFSRGASGRFCELRVDLHPQPSWANERPDDRLAHLSRMFLDGSLSGRISRAKLGTIEPTEPTVDAKSLAKTLAALESAYSP